MPCHLNKVSCAGFELFGKEELHLNTQDPVWPKRRLLHIVKRLHLRINRLLMDFPQFPHSAAKRNHPFISTGGFPIGRKGWGGYEIEAIFYIIVNEVLQRGDTHLISISVARVRPHLAPDNSNDPVALHGEGNG